MRYIDRTGKKISEPGVSKEIKSMGKLTRRATKIAEAKNLAVMKTSHGTYRVIRACGLGWSEETFANLEEVNSFLNKLS